MKVLESEIGYYQNGIDIDFLGTSEISTEFKLILTYCRPFYKVITIGTKTSMIPKSINYPFFGSYDIIGEPRDLSIHKFTLSDIIGKMCKGIGARNSHQIQLTAAQDFIKISKGVYFLHNNKWYKEYDFSTMPRRYDKIYQW